MNSFSAGLVILILITSCSNVDNKKLVKDFRNTSLEKKPSFLCDDFVFEMINEAEFPAGESSIKQLIGGLEGFKLSDTKTTIHSITKLEPNQIEVILKNDSWVYECFGSGTSTTREVYLIRNNKICKIVWEEIEKDAFADSISTAAQTDFNNWLDEEDLRTQLNAEMGLPMMEKYLKFLKVYCDGKEEVL